MKESAKECDVKSEEASRQVLARNEFETAGVEQQEEEEEEREGTPPLIPTFTILLFQAGKNARERKAISNKNLTTSTTKGILLHLLESLSPIGLWKATALGFIFIVQKN